MRIRSLERAEAAGDTQPETDRIGLERSLLVPSVEGAEPLMHQNPDGCPDKEYHPRGWPPEDQGYGADADTEKLDLDHAQRRLSPSEAPVDDERTSHTLEVCGTCRLPYVGVPHNVTIGYPVRSDEPLTEYVTETPS